MASVVACPDRDTLQRLLLGQLDGSEGARLAHHLEACDRCAAVVKTLRAEDVFVEAVRSPSPLAGLLERKSVVALMVQLIRGGPPPTGRKVEGPITSSGGETNGGGSAPTPPQSRHGDAPYEFLSPPQAPDEIGRLGTYRVLEVLGTGGMGVVFRAEDVQLKRQVALKVIKPGTSEKFGARERFFREAQAAAALDHENIVTVYQVGEEGGVPFLAMQWLKGMSLEDRLQRKSPLSVPQVLRLGWQIARGLAVAHEAGLVHRDIKPANLWLEPIGEPGRVRGEPGRVSAGSSAVRVKILDFGLARVEVDNVKLTQPDMLVGTPGYLAPEQALGGKVDGRSDLFSLGVVLYRMCTGEVPFKGENALAALTALVSDAPTPVRALNAAVPPALEQLVMQLLAKDAADRPASAREVLDRLEGIQRGLAEPSSRMQPPPLPVRVVEGREARRWGLIAAVVALAVVLPLGYLFGGVMVRFATNKGQVVIEVDDPEVEVTVKEGGAVIQDGKGKRTITLAAGEHELEVTVKDAAGELRFVTKKLTLSRGGKEIVKVRQEIARARPAETINKEERAFKAEVRILPVKAPALERRASTWVLTLGGAVTILDGANVRVIQAVKDLPAGQFQLLEVHLNHKQEVTDAGLAHLKASPNLTCVWIAETNVSDAAMGILTTLPRLQKLHLAGTQISDIGATHLSKLTNLTWLALNSTLVSDRGLEHLKPLRKLTFLDLSYTRIGDDGVAALKGLPHLTELNLWRTQVTNDALTHLQALPSLSNLNIGGTGIGDAGLTHLKGLSNLTRLNLKRTSISDVGLEHVKSLRKLTDLVLADTQVSADGLVHLKALTNLRDLSLSRMQLNEAGIGHLVALPSLTTLFLYGGTDESLKNLPRLTRLMNLDLGNSGKVTPAGVAALQKALPMCRIVGAPTPK